MTPYEAREVLTRCRAHGDFHRLDSEAVESIIAAADRHKYRQPRNANGSRARYFHAFLTRVAARATLAKLVATLNGPVLRVSWVKHGTCEAGEFLTRWPDEADAFQAEKVAAGCEVERDTLRT